VGAQRACGGRPLTLGAAPRACGDRGGPGRWAAPDAPRIFRVAPKPAPLACAAPERALPVAAPARHPLPHPRPPPPCRPPRSATTARCLEEQAAFCGGDDEALEAELGRMVRRGNMLLLTRAEAGAPEPEEPSRVERATQGIAAALAPLRGRAVGVPRAAAGDAQ
jgi:hypothetical protein